MLAERKAPRAAHDDGWWQLGPQFGQQVVDCPEAAVEGHHLPGVLAPCEEHLVGPFIPRGDGSLGYVQGWSEWRVVFVDQACGEFDRSVPRREQPAQVHPQHPWLLVLARPSTQDVGRCFEDSAHLRIEHLSGTLGVGCVDACDLVKPSGVGATGDLDIVGHQVAHEALLVQAIEQMWPGWRGSIEGVATGPQRVVGVGQLVRLGQVPVE